MSRKWNELLMDDHQKADQLMTAMEKLLSQPEPPDLQVLRKSYDFFSTYIDQCHNLKEENHLFPLIEKLGIPRYGGPLAVMLQEHEQSRALLAEWKTLARKYFDGDDDAWEPFRKTFLAYTDVMKNHFWKENDILYPMALRVMSDEHGEAVVKGILATEATLGSDTRERFYRMADEAMTGKINDLSYGLPREVLAAVLNRLPIELSFVDAQDEVRYFSHENHDKIFPRSRGVIGMKVQNCHPAKSVHVVNKILADFKAGTRDVAEFWINLGERTIHIRYWPVRDNAGKYLGCLEGVQDVTSIKKLTGQKRLLDAAE